MKKIIVACGGAVVTSTIAANKIIKLCKENEIEIDICQCGISEIEANLPADLIVTTSNIKRNYGVKMITGMSFITGAGIEKTEEDILAELKK